MATADFEIATRDEKYINTINEIRAKDFSMNLPFLILSEKLPEGQAYQEFRDGHIELHEVLSNGLGFKTLKILTTAEADQVRKDYGLF